MNKQKYQKLIYLRILKKIDDNNIRRDVWKKRVQRYSKGSEAEVDREIVAYSSDIVFLKEKPKDIKRPDIGILMDYYNKIKPVYSELEDAIENSKENYDDKGKIRKFFFEVEFFYSQRKLLARAIDLKNKTIDALIEKTR